MRANPDPTRARTAIGMIRVSKENGRGDRLISPEIQRTSILECAARRGYIVVDWVEGIDESGSRRKSAWWNRLDAVIDRVESGELEGIIVWELSRTARNRLRWNVAIDRVESAGGSIESATEDIDTTTASGRFQRGMLAEMHAYKAEQIGETWKETHEYRRRKGLPAQGGERFGYRRTKNGGYKPDDETGPVLAEMYRRYVDGHGFTGIAHWLNQEGVTTLRGGMFAHDKVRGILESGFGAGLIVRGARTGDPTYLRGAHKGVISAQEWESYRQRRTGTPRPARHVTPTSMLAGILRCECGAPMRSVQRNGLPGYGCGRYLRFRDTRYVTCARSHAETAVMGWLEGVREDVDALALARVAVLAQQKVATVNRENIDVRLRRLDEQMGKLTVGWSTGKVPDAAYDLAAAKFNEEREALVRRRGRSDPTRATEIDLREMVIGVEELWPDMTVLERREFLSKVIDRVVVVPPEVRKIGGAGPVRFRVIPRWESDQD